MIAYLFENNNLVIFSKTAIANTRDIRKGIRSYGDEALKKQ